MLTVIRYTAAALCLAASVGCLLLWWRSFTYYDQVTLGIPFQVERAYVTTFYGSCDVTVEGGDFHFAGRQRRWQFSTTHKDRMGRLSDIDMVNRGGFGRGHACFYFPLWYPALIFALASVGILRVNRFTIRSALVGMTIVAALLGMIVVL